MVRWASDDSVLGNPVDCIYWISVHVLWGNEFDWFLVQVSFLLLLFSLVESLISSQKVLRNFMDWKVTCIGDSAEMTVVKRIYRKTQNCSFDLGWWQKLKWSLITILKRKATDSDLFVNAAWNDEVGVLLIAWENFDWLDGVFIHGCFQ